MDIAAMTGTPYGYEYIELPREVKEDALLHYCRQTRTRCAAKAKTLDDGANTSWVVRIYIALKYVLGASVLLGTAEYGRERNVLATLPYATYYAVLHCARALLLTDVTHAWKAEKSLRMSHQHIINSVIEHLRRVDSDLAARWEGVVRRARAQRELLSYGLPAQGLHLLRDHLVSLEDATRLCRLFTELAQLNTECLESSVKKWCGPLLFLPNHSDVRLTMEYDDYFDDEDGYRVGWVSRKQQRVTNLAFMATDGLVEDFFGAWHDGRCEGGFDPDDYMNLLLRSG